MSDRKCFKYKRELNFQCVVPDSIHTSHKGRFGFILPTLWAWLYCHASGRLMKWDEAISRHFMAGFVNKASVLIKADKLSDSFVTKCKILYGWMITLVDIITRRNNCAIFCVQFFFFLVINVHANRHSSNYSEFTLVFRCTVQLLLVILSNTHVICKLFSLK